MADPEDDQDLDAEGEKQEDLRNRFNILFKTFDEDGDGCIEHGEIGHLIRCLRLSPPQASVETIIKQLTKGTGKISAEVLLPRIQSAVENEEWQMASLSQVEKAFEKLAEENLLTTEALVKLLSMSGEPFTPAESKQFINHLTIKKNDEIDWRNYIKETCEAIEINKDKS